MLAIAAGDARLGAQPQARPTFRAGVELVSVAATVTDRRGRLVRSLSRDDFEVIDRGEPRRIVTFQWDRWAPVSVALLVDVSGSMRVASKIDAARLAAGQVLGRLRANVDEAALFAFDHELHELRSFGGTSAALPPLLGGLEPFGTTSLYDAVADAARRTRARAARRGAVVVVTDGVDTSSRLTPPEVSAIASSIDVPVYVVAVVSSVDHPGDRNALEGASSSPVVGNLSNLAYWTGGDLYFVSAPAHATVVAQQLLEELRHQYLLAFEAGSPGWHPLEIRTRNRRLTVRARGAYLSGQPRSGGSYQ